MSDNEAFVAVASMVFAFGTFILLFRMWLNRGRAAPPPQLQPLMDRLVHIEQTLDSVAIEVERISEAQRFATKLLADREKAPVLAESRGGREGR